MKSVLLMTVAAVLMTVPVMAQEAVTPEFNIESESSQSTLPAAAPLTGLEYIQGKPIVKFEEGKVYVVEFWATWCGPCKVSIPHLTEVQKKYKDKGVTVIGISDEEELGPIKDFVKAQGEKMVYTVAWDPKRKVSDGYMTRFKQQGIPTAFIVDQKGKVAWYGHPMVEMDDVLEKVVAKTFDPVAYAKEKAEREALDRKLQELYRKYLTDIINGKSLEEARPTAEAFIEIGHAEALNGLAWQILTLPQPDKRDVPTALKAALKANTLTKGENPSVLDTYAVALFQSNKFAEAVAAQEKAIALAKLAEGNEAMMEELKDRLEQFKKALEESKD
jgi:thiol-disulfide isomerase/thioredoxin